MRSTAYLAAAVTFYSIAAFAQSPCDPGSFRDPNTNLCALCPEKTYSFGGSTGYCYPIQGCGNPNYEAYGPCFCPDGSTSSTNTGSRLDCSLPARTCSPGSYVNPDSYLCERCPGGMWSDGGQDGCYATPDCDAWPNWTLNKAQTDCICPEGFKTNGHNCDQICTTSQGFDSDSRRCYDVPDCSAVEGTRYDEETNSCVCLDNYSKVGGSTTCSLVLPTCSANTYLQERTCKPCPAGTTSVGGSVTLCTSVVPTCGTNEKLVENTCKCLDNYSKIGSSTTCTLVVSSCPFNFYLINKDCAACPPGTTSSGGSASSCTAVTPTCASNEVLVDNVCQCKAGFEKNNNICIQTACSSSEVRDQTSQLCVPCPAGFTSINGRCSPTCGKGSTLNPISNTCVCSPGYAFDDSKTCVKLPAQCQNGFSLDALKKKCVCGSGKEERLGFCVEKLKCLNNFTLDSLFKNCVCLWPFSLDKNGQCKKHW